MVLFIDLARAAVWLSLVALAVFGEVPWWLPIVAFVYDLNYPVHFMVPGTRKRWERLIAKQRQKQLDAAMYQLNVPAGRKDS